LLTRRATRRNRSRFSLVDFAVALSILVAICTTTCADEPTPLDHRHVLFYADDSGAIHPVTNIDHWQLRRRDIIRGMEAAMGPLPDRTSLPDLDIQITESLETPDYVRHTLTFASEPGDRTPVFLYIPRGASPDDPRPGIVALHGTHELGKARVDGAGLPNRAYGKELAERGYVVIAPDYPPYGDYAGYDFESDRYDSGSMKGIWNHMRCVDLLQQRDDVLPDRIGAIGHSLGGHNAMFLGVFDERVQAIVSSCGWTPFHDYYAGNIKGWTSDRYMQRLDTIYDLDPDRVPFDFYEVVAALAPRAFFSNSPLHDSNFDYRGVEKAAPQARRVYELYSVPDRLRITYPNVEHDFPPDIREESYQFLDQYLRPH
jgi:acetyl esterase/lipase